MLTVVEHLCALGWVLLLAVSIHELCSCFHFIEWENEFQKGHTGLGRWLWGWSACCTDMGTWVWTLRTLIELDLVACTYTCSPMCLKWYGRERQKNHRKLLYQVSGSMWWQHQRETLSQARCRRQALLTPGCPLTFTCVPFLHTHSDHSVLFSLGIHGSPAYSFASQTFFFQIPTPHLTCTMCILCQPEGL